MGMRAQDAQFFHGLDKVDAVIIMLLNPRCHGKDIGIKDNVLRRKANADQKVVGALANLDLAGLRVSLPGFIERHDHDGSAISHAEARVM